MERKTLIGIIAVCAVVLVLLMLLVVVLVGVMEGAWPWQGKVYYQAIGQVFDTVTGNRPGEGDGKGTLVTDPVTGEVIGDGTQSNTGSTTPTLKDENQIDPTEVVQVPETQPDDVTEPTEKDTVKVSADSIPGF